MDNDAATRFLAAFTALHDFVASKPPEPFLQAAGQAMNLLSSLAASVMINAERARKLDATQEKAEALGHAEKTKARAVPAAPRNGV